MQSQPSYPLIQVLQGRILSDLLTFAEIPLNAYCTKVDHTKLDGSFIADKLLKISDKSFKTLEIFGVANLSDDFLLERKWVIVSDDFRARSFF